MITITAVMDGDELVSLTSEGHGGYASHGYDIVCAAVSVLMQALDLGLCDVIRAGSYKKEFVPDGPQGPMMQLSWRDGRGEARALGRTILESLEAVAAKYRKYVRVVRENYDRNTEDC